MRIWIVVIVTAALAACSGPTAPQTASAGQTPAVVVPPGPAASSLAISSFGIQPAGAPRIFVPEMLLTETSGKSAARIDEIRFTDQDGDDYLIGSYCFKDPVIAAGQTLDIATASPSCLIIDAYFGITTLKADVTFEDDEGRAGATSTTLTVGK